MRVFIVIAKIVDEIMHIDEVYSNEDAAIKRCEELEKDEENMKYYYTSRDVIDG